MVTFGRPRPSHCDPERHILTRQARAVPWQCPMLVRLGAGPAPTLALGLPRAWAGRVGAAGTGQRSGLGAGPGWRGGHPPVVCGLDLDYPHPRRRGGFWPKGLDKGRLTCPGGRGLVFWRKQAAGTLMPWWNKPCLLKGLAGLSSSRLAEMGVIGGGNGVKTPDQP